MGRKTRRNRSNRKDRQERRVAARQILAEVKLERMEQAVILRQLREKYFPVDVPYRELISHRAVRLEANVRGVNA